eukprot:jgi/Mesvir1/12566/Mv18452-RA.1
MVMLSSSPPVHGFQVPQAVPIQAKLTNCCDRSSGDAWQRVPSSCPVGRRSSFEGDSLLASFASPKAGVKKWYITNAVGDGALSAPVQGSASEVSSRSGVDSGRVPRRAVGFKVSAQGLPPRSVSSSGSAEGLLKAAFRGGGASNVVPMPSAFRSRAPQSPKKRNILEEAQAAHHIFFDPIVIEAFHMAERAYEGKFRKNGDPVIVHFFETARILADMKADVYTVSAALLHGVLADGKFTVATIRDALGEQVSYLVELVAQMTTICQTTRSRNRTLTPEELRHLRNTFVAMGSSSGVTAVLIKLADRLHDMRTLDALPEEQQQSIAEETLDVFSPLANRLGMYRMKAELEDLCFQYLHKEECEALKQQLAGMNSGGTMMGDTMRRIQELLRRAGIAADIYGRPKNLYSTYRKMTKKDKSLLDINDLFAIRVVVQEKRQCYDVLNLIHKEWNHLAHCYKDYIVRPKESGYSSLHTVLTMPSGPNMEVQVRTTQMHHMAEYGMAAHWQYKEGEAEDDETVNQLIRWKRAMLSWANEAIALAEDRSSSGLRHISSSPDDAPGPMCAHAHGALHEMCAFPNHSPECCFGKLATAEGMREQAAQGMPIYPFLGMGAGEDPTAKVGGVVIIIMADGDIVALPAGATAATVLDRELTGRGYAMGSVARCNYAVMVNGQRVPLTTPVQMGDLISVVEEGAPVLAGGRPSGKKEMHYMDSSYHVKSFICGLEESLAETEGGLHAEPCLVK